MLLLLSKTNPLARKGYAAFVMRKTCQRLRSRWTPFWAACGGKSFLHRELFYFSCKNS